MTTHRQQRVSDLLREELGMLIAAELTDPRLVDAMVTVTRVDVSADLHNARVYVEHALEAKESRHVVEALQHAETFLRKALVENLNLRFVPHLSFQVDEVGLRVRRIDELLDSLAGQSPAGPLAPDEHEHDDTE